MSSLSFPNDFTAGTTISSSQVNANFTAAETWSATISDDNFSSSAGMYSAYRTIHETNGSFGSDLAANTYFFSGFTVVVTGGAGQGAPSIYLDDADYAISGRTTRLRVRGVVSSNATAPAINFTFGLAPVTVAGGADTMTFSLGAAVAGGNVSINTPSASTSTAGTGSDFAVPADGLYALFVSTSGTIANNSMCNLKVALQQRWT